jgi:bacterioferritin
MKEQTRAKAVETLNKILEMELAGTIHYTHYSFMVFGYTRIPIVNWLEKQANESMAHARAAGELVTQLGAHPSLGIGPLLETHKHDIGDIMRESLGHEKKTLVEYEKLLDGPGRGHHARGIRARAHLPGTPPHRRSGQDAPPPRRYRKRGGGRKEMNGLWIV